MKSASNATVYRMAGGISVPISSMSLVGSSYIVSLNDSSINWLRSNAPTDTPPTTEAAHARPPAAWAAPALQAGGGCAILANSVANGRV